MFLLETAKLCTVVLFAVYKSSPQYDLWLSVWDFHHCHKKSELTHPNLHFIWFLDCRCGLETLKMWNKKPLCLTEQASS